MPPAETVAEAQESIQTLHAAVKLATGVSATELIDERYELDPDNADPFNLKRYIGRATMHFAGQVDADVLSHMQA
jgi:hypothetical protein